MTRPLHPGRGLNKYPLSAVEFAEREVRRRELKQARRAASTVVDNDGRRWTLVRLPDRYGQDIPFDADLENPYDSERSE